MFFQLKVRVLIFFLRRVQVWLNFRYVRVFKSLFFTIHRERHDGAEFEKDASRGARLRVVGGGRAQTFGRFQQIFLVTEAAATAKRKLIKGRFNVLLKSL